VPGSMDSFVVGIIGMGDMGKMYARRLSEAGWRVNACDREEKYESLRGEYDDKKNIKIFPNGHLVSRASDYIIYNVEAASIDKVVAQYGPSTKQDAIVGGQTSCKAPEIAAFEKHLPADIDIVSCHSLHGPNVDPKGQPLVRDSRDFIFLLTQSLRSLSNIVPPKKTLTKLSMSCHASAQPTSISQPLSTTVSQQTLKQ